MYNFSKMEQDLFQGIDFLFICSIILPGPIFLRNGMS